VGGVWLGWYLVSTGGSVIANVTYKVKVSVDAKL